MYVYVYVCMYCLRVFMHVYIRLYLRFRINQQSVTAKLQASPLEAADEHLNSDRKRPFKRTKLMLLVDVNNFPLNE